MKVMAHTQFACMRLEIVFYLKPQLFEIQNYCPIYSNITETKKSIYAQKIGDKDTRMHFFEDAVQQVILRQPMSKLVILELVTKGVAKTNDLFRVV